MAQRPPYQSVFQIVERHARERGNKVHAIAAESGFEVTFDRVYTLCNQMASFLAKRGFKANDRVSVLSDNCLSQMLLFHMVQAYGATVNLVNCEVHTKNVEQILDDIDPKLVLWHRDLAPELQAIAMATGVEHYVFDDHPEATPTNEFFALLENEPATPSVPLVGTPGDWALINYTSGTTSSPKGVCCTHESYFYMTESDLQAFRLTENERMLEFRGVTWCSPQVLSVCTTLQVGATIVLAKKFSQSHFFEWVQKYRVTVSAGVPTAITMLLARPHPITKADLPTLRYMTTSTAPIAPETFDAFQNRYGIRLVQGCGMSEAGFMFVNDPDAPRRGPVGRRTPHITARFVDPEGNDMPVGVEGELLIGGIQIFSGYLVGRGTIDRLPAEGFRTGDLGYYDQDGYAFLTGRKKDLIIRGGINIAPLEVSSILAEHPSVLEAATIGVPDNIYGEAVACFVVPQTGHAPSVEDLRVHLQRKLSPYKMPQSISFMIAIPKTDRGKTSKDGLMRFWREHVQPTLVEGKH